MSVESMGAIGLGGKFMSTKQERVVTGILLTALTVYTIYNYHVNIKLNKLRIAEQEAKMGV